MSEVLIESLLLFVCLTFIVLNICCILGKRSNYFLLFHQCPSPYYKKVHSAELASPILWLIFRHGFPKCSWEHSGRSHETSRSCLKGRGTAIAFTPVWQRINQWSKTLPFGGSGAEWHLPAKCLFLWKSKHWDMNHHIRSQLVNFSELCFPCFVTWVQGSSCKELVTVATKKRKCSQGSISLQSFLLNLETVSENKVCQYSKQIHSCSKEWSARNI